MSRLGCDTFLLQIYFLLCDYCTETLASICLLSFRKPRRRQSPSSFPFPHVEESSKNINLKPAQHKSYTELCRECHVLDSNANTSNIRNASTDNYFKNTRIHFVFKIKISVKLILCRIVAIGHSIFNSS